MKIIKQTGSQLTIRHNPVLSWLGMGLFGSIFVGAGLMVIIGFAKVSTLTCQRVQLTEGSCQLEESGLLGAEKKQIPLNTLQGAKVNITTSNSTSRNRTSSNRTYNVVLLTQTGEIPFTSYSTSDSEQTYSIASQINNFVNKSQQTSLKVKQDDLWFGYLFGGVFIAAGILVVIRGMSQNKIINC